VGWQVVALNGQVFAEELLDSLRNGTQPYEMTFVKRYAGWLGKECRVTTNLNTFMVGRAKSVSKTSGLTQMEGWFDFRRIRGHHGPVTTVHFDSCMVKLEGNEDWVAMRCLEEHSNCMLDGPPYYTKDMVQQGATGFLQWGDEVHGMTTMMAGSRCALNNLDHTS